MNFTDKYQPKNASQIIGASQKRLAASLEKLAVGENIKPIMIVGHYGTGKTTLAEMFVELLRKQDEVDLIRIDCATDRGINQMRELTPGFSVGSLFGGYKVYFLDEIHKLTNDGQDILLKPLEKDLHPKTVIIVATTSEDTLKGMLKSRFSRYYLEKPTTRDMQQLCHWVSAKENFELANDIRDEIIIRSEGSVRDLVTFLEQVANDNYTSFSQLEEEKENLMQLIRSKNLSGLLSYETNDYNGTLIGICTYAINALKNNSNDKIYEQVLQVFGQGLNQNLPQNVAWAKLVVDFVDNN